MQFIHNLGERLLLNNTCNRLRVSWPARLLALSYAAFFLVMHHVLESGGESILTALLALAFLAGFAALFVHSTPNQEWRQNIRSACVPLALIALASAFVAHRVTSNSSGFVGGFFLTCFMLVLGFGAVWWSIRLNIRNYQAVAQRAFDA